MKITTLPILVLLGGLALQTSLARAAEPADSPLPDRVEFNRDIRPILSDNCFACHGFDQAKRKADLRLDVKDGLSAKLDNGSAVVPGKPADSLVYSRVVTDDPDEVMPPPSSKRTLTSRQKALLKRWIEQGAGWEDHWSYQPVRRPAMPTIANPTWVRNPVDAFILARLEKEGLKPAAEADKATLIRRVTLDLTGLPPTPAEVDAFVADASPGAYEKVVDRLLSSVRYGERMALEWLDAARYADTHGYHIDSGRDMTRWREWVIDAFHRNKPYDVFTVEQLAGDLLPDAATPEATLAQRVASGFNRNHMVNFEGGAIAEEYRTAYVLDRVNTTGTVWLGLTVACTQCHDHKYDPITQKEYFGLYAFFNNIAEKGLDGNFGNAMPYLATPRPEQKRALAELTVKVTELEAHLAGPLAEADAAQAEWEASLPAAAKAKVAWHAPAAAKLESQGGATLKPQPDRSILVTEKNPAKETYAVTLPVPPELQRVTGIRLEALPDKSLPAGGPGRSDNGNAVLTEFKVAVARDDQAGSPGKASASPVPVRVGRASAGFSQTDFDVAGAIDGKPATGWAIHPEVGKPHEAVFELAEPIEASADARLVVALEFKSQFAQHQFGRFRLSLTDLPNPSQAGQVPATVAAVLAVGAEERTDAQQVAVRDHFRRGAWAGGRGLVERLSAAKKAREDLEKAIPNAMVMQELDKPRDTFVLKRGEYDKPGEKVTPGVPSFLPPLPADAPANRLTLARWLVDRQHPLTGRVTVNRYWQMVFGTGLVKTVEDFGSQGELPSHADLLDWLAADFMDGPENPDSRNAPGNAPAAGGGPAHYWDVRRLIRTLVTSSAYRQASPVTTKLLGRDPENRLLARGTRYRLQAELIRDQALAASGLLDSRVGGYSVSPYQPAGLWEELMSRGDGAKWTAQTYVQSKGADLYRRTMYTFWKRTSPPPTLSTFDAPDRETCTVRRGRTNTPLQALVLMNDPTYIEAARKLAERALAEPPAGVSDGDRIGFAFRTVLARQPRAEEVAVLTAVLEKQRAKFAADKAAAVKLLAVGESPRDERLDQAELAAWATVCSVILNLDEAVTRG